MLAYEIIPKPVLMYQTGEGLSSSNLSRWKLVLQLVSQACASLKQEQEVDGEMDASLKELEAENKG